MRISKEALKPVSYGSAMETNSSTKNGIWARSLSAELEYWERYVDSKGFNNEKSWNLRFNPNTVLYKEFAELISPPANSLVRILDVGAGPATTLGKTLENVSLQISAIDPLAVSYNQILDRHNIIPPVRTTYGTAEELDETFACDYFDFIHVKNAIDHSYDPMLAIEKIVTVLKPDKFAYLRHFVREGKKNAYKGLHQWDFWGQDDEFFLGNSSEKVSITRKLANVAAIHFKIIKAGTPEAALQEFKVVDEEIFAYIKKL